MKNQVQVRADQTMVEQSAMAQSANGKKYTIRRDLFKTVTIDGVEITVWRIEWLHDFKVKIRLGQEETVITVSAGTLGGWVQDYRNLDDDLNYPYSSAILDDAIVCGNACVMNAAVVCGHAIVYAAGALEGLPRIWISDTVSVCNHAMVTCDETSEVDIANQTCVRDYARIKLSDHSYLCVKDHSELAGCAWLYCHYGFLCDDATVRGCSAIGGSLRMRNNAVIDFTHWGHCIVDDNAVFGEDAFITEPDDFRVEGPFTSTAWGCCTHRVFGTFFLDKDENVHFCTLEEGQDLPWGGYGGISRHVIDYGALVDGKVLDLITKLTKQDKKSFSRIAVLLDRTIREKLDNKIPSGLSINRHLVTICRKMIEYFKCRRQEWVQPEIDDPDQMISSRDAKTNSLTKTNPRDLISEA